MKKLITLLFIVVLAACSKTDTESVGDTTGKNGSITRFAIRDNLMYAIDLNCLRVFDITNNDQPVLVHSVQIDYGLETIFIYGNHIYLGAVDGVYILDINNPTNPVQTEKIEHHVSCDPVVVQGNYAYSTQRVSTEGCGRQWFTSALAIYDVTTPSAPELINTYGMGEPFGLAVEGNWLYVCDDAQGGIVVYDVSVPWEADRVTKVEVNQPRDLILNYPYMLVATKTAFELYNYSDPSNIYFVSSFSLY